MRLRLSRQQLRSLAGSPLAWILVVVGILHAVGIGWGLPASDGWDNDGVAPRDFLPGLAATLTPGQYYTYPPVHLAILAVLTLPVTVVAAVRAPSYAIADIVSEALKVPYMTTIAYVARVTSLAMSLGVVFFAARITEELRAHALGVAAADGDVRVRRAGWCAAAFVGVNASLTYYAHTSNLDVPYLFWGMGSLLFVARAIARREPRLLRRAVVLAVLAVGTKDQAYALFLLSLPAVVGLWLLRDAWVRQHRARVLREIVIALVLGVALLVVVDGAIFNPSGFRARVAFLTGSASQDYVEYTATWSGRLGVLADTARTFNIQYPKIFAVPIAVGLGCALIEAWRTPPDRRSAQVALALLPLFASLSFTVAFNLTARRTDPRFLLPQALLFAVYGGLGVEAVAFASSRAVRLACRSALGVAFALALHLSISVDVNLLHDPRYDAEAWLAAHVRPGETIETYGLNVYLPRMPRGARVIRVAPEPIDKRNPMPGIEEVQAPFAKAGERDARWIVLSTGWVWRYLVRARVTFDPGRQMPPTTDRIGSDAEATEFFDRLLGSVGAFALVHESKYDDRVFPIVEVHGTTGRVIWIYERKP